MAETKNVTLRLPLELAEWLTSNGESVNQAVISCVPKLGNKCVLSESVYAHIVECLTIGRLASHHDFATSANVFLHTFEISCSIIIYYIF